MTSPINNADLTRWNRAGLSRFKYVHGNAITYLEELRLAMRQAFTEGGANKWSELDTAIPEGINENESERQARWIRQYHDQRRDYGWEILRAYARAAHVLTEHLDADSNETFLNTATQWEYLRRLVAMLDYHPAPPASAQTTIVLLAKENKSGRVGAGFAFKNKPQDGSSPVVFETLADLEVEYLLNKLRPADWDKSQEPFVYSSGRQTATFPLEGPVDGVAVGTLGVLLVETESGLRGAAVSVTGISDTAIHLLVEAEPPGFPATFNRHQVRLLLKPRFKQSPQLSGDNVVKLSDGHGLSLRAVVAYRDAEANWRAAQVAEIDGNSVKLTVPAPAEGTKLFITAYADAQDVTIRRVPSNRVILPTVDNREASALFDANLTRISAVPQPDDDSAYTFLPGAPPYNRVYYVPVDAALARSRPSAQESNPQGLSLDGDPGDFGAGSWLITQAGEIVLAAQITGLIEGEASYSLRLSRHLDATEVLFGDFEIDIFPLDYNVNNEPAFVTDEDSRSDSYSILPMSLAEFPPLLDVGRRLIIAGKSSTMAVMVKEVLPDQKTIKVAPAIPGSELTADGTTQDYTRYHTVIYGNVVESGHGETQKQAILGSGDATQTRQTFNFDDDTVSFVVDYAFPSGVRAAIEITIGGRTWKQVASLNTSEPEDSHYTARVKEDGTLLIEFGDGFHGRRLPSGNNNVRLTHRNGSGLAGNLVPYGLDKAVKPHALVESVLQPIASTGGNDMEGVDSLRVNAPASVLTLDRAVSLSDFTHLAATNSGVWQARAFRRQPGSGRAERIEIAVVPAGGGGLGNLAVTLAAFLTAHAIPGVKITVVPYQSIILDLRLTLRIKFDEYDPELVVKDVETAVLDAFSLQQVKLGESLYLSQLYSVVERVEGVANCQCEINPYGFFNETGAAIEPKQLARGADLAIRRVSVAEDQVIYLDQALSNLEIITQAFTL